MNEPPHASTHPPSAVDAPSVAAKQIANKAMPPRSSISSVGSVIRDPTTVTANVNAGANLHGWTADYENILDEIRQNCTKMYEYHKEKYMAMNRYPKYFRIPTIFFSFAGVFASVGIQAYVPQNYISLMTCGFSLATGAINAVELYLNTTRRMSDDLELSKEFYILSIDIYKMLSLEPVNRTVDARIYLEEKYHNYCSIISRSDTVGKPIRDNLSTINVPKYMARSLQQQLLSDQNIIDATTALAGAIANQLQQNAVRPPAEKPQTMLQYLSCSCSFFNDFFTRLAVLLHLRPAAPSAETNAQTQQAAAIAAAMAAVTSTAATAFVEANGVAGIQTISNDPLSAGEVALGDVEKGVSRPKPTGDPTTAATAALSNVVHVPVQPTTSTTPSAATMGPPPQIIRTQPIAQGQPAAVISRTPVGMMIMTTSTQEQTKL